LGKVLLGGFGPSLCCSLWPLDLVALKFLQSLAYRSQLIHELNLCLSIATRSISIVVIVLSSEVGCCTRYVSYLFLLDLDLIFIIEWLYGVSIVWI
jgi:hypothetical protein